MKRILFLTGTRADYGKLKSLMKQVKRHKDFDLKIFVTGMHMLSKYGLTWTEIYKDGFRDTYQFINQQEGTSMDIVLSNTVMGLSNYVHEVKPNLIIVHGDRLEAMAGAIVGAFNNIKVAHIEGGEVSGTIDESIRHAITKLSHLHLVSNEEARQRVIQLGEDNQSIFTIGSPDIDIMLSEQLPTINKVKERYEIPFQNYAILMYHPVTTELDALKANIKNIVESLINSKRNYIVVFPNNDAGNELILDEYKRLENHSNFKVYPSIRFEYFLTLLKNADFIIGNSSAGVREAEIYGIPTIDLGNRQKNRYCTTEAIIHATEDKDEITQAINRAMHLEIKQKQSFGKGNSDKLFMQILEDENFWNFNIQKYFNDMR